MSVFGNKKSAAKAGSDAEPTQKIGARDGDVTKALDATESDTSRRGDAAGTSSTRGTESTRASSSESSSPTAAGSGRAADSGRGGASSAEKVLSANERSRSSYGEESEPTRVEPIGRRTGAAAGGATAGAGAVAASKASTRDDDLDAERRADRDRRRAERDEALGTRRKAVDEVEPARPVKPKRTTDKFFGSLGLFLLRLVTAAIIGLHGLWKVMNLDKVEQMLNGTVIPQPHVMAYVLAAAEIAIALGLLFGMLTRLAGLGLALIGIGALVFVKWIHNPFNGYQLGGELELLLGAVGLLFLLVGAGGWSVDAAFRRRRAANRTA